jgi:hypothetical protein
MSNITDFFKNIVEETDENKTNEEEGEQGEKSDKTPDFEKMFENMPGAEEFKKAFSSDMKISLLKY